MAWMMPLSHSTSDGQLEDLDGPSDLRPMMAPSSQFLRNSVRREGAAVERLLVRVEGVHRLLALDHVVLEHVSRDRRADLVVVLVVGLDVGLVVAEEHAVEPQKISGPPC